LLRNFAFVPRSLTIISLVLVASSGCGGTKHPGGPDGGKAGADGGHPDGVGGAGGNAGVGGSGGGGTGGGGADGGAAGDGSAGADAGDAAGADGGSGADGGDADGAGDGVDADGSSADGADADTAPPVDAGPKPYGSVPPAAPTVYTCASEIHVATTGDDNAGDGTSGMPFKTIGKGVSLATTAGSCVQVHAGTYTPAATITFPNDATAASPIVLRSADGKGMAIIDGSAVAAGATLEVSKDHVVVDGFEFKNSPATVNVVRFDGQYALKCEGSVLRNSKITGGFSELKIYQNSHGVLVENNEFAGSTPNSTASLTGASGLVFRANYVHDMDTGDVGTIELVGGSNSPIFEKNLFQDITSASGALVLGDACSATCDNDPEHYAAVSAVARSNLFIRVNRAMDIMGCKNCSVLSNTIIDAGDTYGYVFKIGSADTNGTTKATTGLRILDNILTSPSGALGYVVNVSGAAGTGLVIDYNLYYDGPGAVMFGSGYPAGADTHSVQGDPRFVSAMDFGPSAGSPAIGAGTNLVTDVPDDFLSVPRPATDPFDIGAFQHATSEADGGTDGGGDGGTD
jgi:hypothetical protein